ncbi:hypothetical protein SDC9_82379 [bioreactor metagenome]|uniref:Histidine kinase n=1 Tax=bioreactor metagenome TaxID=1076179 RepID=A0A644Z4F1_9ZZZZ
MRVTCSLSEDAMLTLGIEDDGAGFDVAAVRRAGLSVGLRSMEARTRRMGAEFHVRSRPGDTALQLVLPLSQQGESAEVVDTAESVS